MDGVWLWMDMREKEKWFSNQKMSIIYMCYCKTLPSYFQESPSDFLYRVHFLKNEMSNIQTLS